MSAVDFRARQAARRIRAIAAVAPGYAPALANLAREVEAAGRGEDTPEAVAADRGPQDWALAVIDAVILGEVRAAR